VIEVFIAPCFELIQGVGIDIDADGSIVWVCSCLGEAALRENRALSLMRCFLEQGIQSLIASVDAELTNVDCN
jgi:hypothetical protein